MSSNADDVRRIALSLPQRDPGRRRRSATWSTAARPSRGRGRSASSEKRARVEQLDVFAVRVAGEEEKQALIASDPEKFFTEPHYNGYPAVLVRLDAIDDDELAELLTDAWRCAAPRRLVAEFDAGHEARRTSAESRRVATARALVVYGRAVAVATRVPRAGSARTADAMLLTVVLLWSGNFTAMRYAVASFHPLAFSSVRFGLGAALYALVVWWREGSLRIARRDFGAILLLAGVGIFANQVAVIYAVQKAGAANVGMLMASAPIIAALLARRLGHERIGARHVVGIAVAATGALLVLYGGGGVGGAPLIGWLLGLVTAATWASYSVLLRPLMARYSAERLSAAVLLTGSAMLIPVSLPQLADAGLGRARPATPGSRSATASCSRCSSRTCSGSTPSTASARRARRSSSTSSRSASR